MDFRFNAHDPRTGAFLYTLPRPSQAQIGDVFGERGTLELTYSAKQARAVNLPTFLEVQAQVQFDGGAWENVGPALIRLGGSHEDTDQAGMRTVQFVGREWLLGRARVGAGDLPLIDGKRPFYQASAGQIIRSLLLEAQDRGAADGIELGPFTNTTDSAGNAWSERVTIYYSPGLPIGDVLANLVEQGVCDYRMEGRTLHVYEPETDLGRDLTDRDHPVRVHGAVTEAPVKYSLEDLANSALLIGEDGFQVEVNNPSAPDDYGRLEVTIEQGGVNQEGTARTLIDAELQRGSREIREITRTQHAAAAHALPYRDYRAGDYVQAFDDGQWVRYRVREIQVVRDAGGWTVHTVLNDRLQELLLSLARKTNGIVNGSRGSGGDGTRPAPPQKPGVEPAAPQGLVIDQQVYLDDSGTARGVITAGWGEVTESTAGLAIDIGGYELWWRENTTFATWTRATATSGDTTVDQSPVILTAADGSAMEYQWRVRAVAQASNRPGPWSNTVTLTMTQDTTPPPPPSAPVVSTGFRIVTVEWDGVDENGQDMPRDFSRVRVYLAPAEDMVGARLSGSLAHPGSWNSETMPADVPVWVALSAVDRVGNESTMTAAVSVTPRQLVDDEKIREELDGIDDTIRDAEASLREDIENIVIDDTGAVTYWLPTEPDETTDPPPKLGDIWFNTADGNALSRHDGQGWVPASDERFNTLRDAQDALESEVDSVRTSVDGKNAITQSTSTPPAQYGGAVGDRWERMSSMGSGGRLISNWRWNGDVWVSTIIGDAVLGNVDAAKIGTGYLNADRIDSHSITADKLLIGDAGSLIPWSTATTAPHLATGGLSLVSVVDPDIGETLSVTGGTATGWAEAIRFYYNSETFVIPTSPDTEYRFSALLGRVGGAVRAQMFIAWYDASGNYTSGSYGPDITDIPKGGVEQFSFHATSRSDSYGVRVALRVESPMPDAWLRIKEARFEPTMGATLIQDGAITTGKIATGAITSDAGIFGTMDAGILNAGEISSDRIGAKTITADKLLVGAADELVAEPFFTSEGKGWSLSSNASVEDSAAENEMSALRVDGSGDYESNSSNEWTVNGAEKYGVRVRLKTSQGTSASGQIIIYIRSRRAGGGYSYSSLNLPSLPAGEWVTFEAQIETSDDAVAACMQLSPRNTFPAGNTVWFSRASTRRQAGATLIQDGAITTDKILANAITAGKIAALAIEADHIAANAIQADKIDAGAIDGKIITGATVRTNESGARVQLDSTGLRAYDASGSQTFSASSWNGAVSMTGNLSQSNAYGSLTVGPSLFNVSDGGNGSPAITLREAGSTVWGPAGILLKESGADQTLNIQGPLDASGQGAYLALPVFGSSRSAGIRRMFGEGDHSYLSLSNDRNVWANSNGGHVYAQSQGATAGNGGVYLRTYEGSRSYSQAFMSIVNDGSAYIQTQVGSNKDAVTGRLSMGSEGTWLRAGSGNSATASRNLWLQAYGNAYFQAWGTGNNPSAEAYVRAENSGELTMAGVGGTSYFRVRSDEILQAHGIWRNVMIDPLQSVVLNNSGHLGIYGSSRRWKEDIEKVDPTTYEDGLLSLDVSSWTSTKAVARSQELAEWRAANPMAPTPEHLSDAHDTPPRQVGMIAEDVADAGLEPLVGRDEYGRPMTIVRENFGMMLVPIIRRLRDRVDALETRLGATA